MDDSMITCDEIIDAEENETVPTSKRKGVCKTQNFYILLALVLMTIALLIAVSIYCYLIKYRAKQKHLQHFHVTNNKLKQIIY